MKQAILAGQGRIEIRDVPVPEPSAGEVLVKIDTALTCGTDLKAYVRGHDLIPMPGPFGHEYSGTIAKAGKDVTAFKEGDDVMGVHSAPCLECGYCKRRLYNLCEALMQSKVLGAFSEYLLLPANIVRQNLYQKPYGLSFEQAALLEPLSCVVHPYSKLNFDKIETALVIGAGPIGLMHIIWLTMNSIDVIAADISPDRLSAAEEIGAIATPTDELENTIKNATDNLGADLIIECTGQKDVWEQAVNYSRRGGTIVLFGGCPAGANVTYDSHRLHYDELTLLGSFHYTPRNVRTAYQALIEKKLDLSMLISGEFPLEETEKAFNLLKEGKGIKYALKP